MRSAHDPKILNLLSPVRDYPKIREAAAGLIKAGHINEILAASYARLLVDEYQDCSISQHLMVSYAAQALPTCVLGDPMQAIFGFGGDRLPDWNGEVCVRFPLAGQLTTPWRWINAGAADLGEWLLDVRLKLSRGDAIDVVRAPNAVRWIELDGTNDYQRRLSAAGVRSSNRNDSILIIGYSRNPDFQHKFARHTPGAATVEAVDMRDLLAFARSFSVLAPKALEQLVRFATCVMTNVRATELIRRVQTLGRGTARNQPSDLERVALTFLREPSHRAAIDLLVEISKQGDVRRYRPAILSSCIRALQLCDGTDGLTFQDAAIQIREQGRFAGRRLPRRAVGSTLLLKGLEAEIAIVLDADRLNARNLYVAMTRGSKELSICSRTSILNTN